MSDTSVTIYKGNGDFKKFALYLKTMGNGYFCTAKLPAKAGNYILGDYGAQGSLASSEVLIMENNDSYTIQSRSSQTYCYRVVGYR